jgi:hypothetical protein
VNPEKNRRRSPYTASVDTVLVQFTAELLPHDSPEFQERAKRVRPTQSSPQPLEEKPKPGQDPPASS